LEAALLDIQRVHKAYGATTALRGVSLQAAAGEIVALLGPSGCGKSTLLRLVSGLEAPDAGTITFGGTNLAGVPPHRRGFGLMFQDYALFPHLDVAANVAFGLHMRGTPPAASRARVAELLDLVGLAGYERRRVYQLSGGERQRVALARTLAPDPQLLMLDEPLGALDRALREQLLEELAAILRRVRLTTLYVTHDQQEAFALADTLVLMRAGQIEQLGPPEAVYRQPATLFAAQFLGIINLVPATVAADGTLETSLGRLPMPPHALEQKTSAGYADTADLDLLNLQYPRNLQIVPGERVTLAIRPEGAELANESSPGDLFVVVGVIVERLFRGSVTRLMMRHESGQVLTFELDGAGLPAVGEMVRLAIRADALSMIAEHVQGRALPRPVRHE
jgi:ABC-type Fe3+/spermidine/putrescine transport system ATPase subunit